MKRLLPLALALLLGSCATNSFTQFYQSRIAGASPEQLNRQLQPYSGTTQIMGLNNAQKDIEELFRRGYVLIGESNFEGAGAVTQDQLREQAKLVGADIVLYQSKYQGAEQSALPILQYTPGQVSTTYNSGQVNNSVYGTVNTNRVAPTYASGTGNYTGYGNANYSGVSTTTTSGTYSTTMVPITLHRYEHHALYFRQGKIPVFGVGVVNMPDEMRMALRRNTGALVKTVRYDTPAFRANVFPGDVIIAIDDTPIESYTDFMTKIASFGGKECTVIVLRDGKETPLKVKMNPNPL